MKANRFERDTKALAGHPCSSYMFPRPLDNLLYLAAVDVHCDRCLPRNLELLARHALLSVITLLYALLHRLPPSPLVAAQNR